MNVVSEAWKTLAGRVIFNYSVTEIQLIFKTKQKADLKRQKKLAKEMTKSGQYWNQFVLKESRTTVL